MGNKTISKKRISIASGRNRGSGNKAISSGAKRLDITNALKPKTVLFDYHKSILYQSPDEIRGTVIEKLPLLFSIIRNVTKAKGLESEFLTEYNKQSDVDDQLRVLVEWAHKVKHPDAYIHFEENYTKVLEFSDCGIDITDCSVSIEFLDRMQVSYPAVYEFYIDTISMLHDYCNVQFWNKSRLFDVTCECSGDMHAENIDMLQKEIKKETNEERKKDLQEQLNDTIKYNDALASDIIEINELKECFLPLFKKKFLTLKEYKSKHKNIVSPFMAVNMQELFNMVCLVVKEKVSIWDYEENYDTLKVLEYCSEDSLEISETMLFMWKTTGPLWDEYEQTLNQTANELGVMPAINKNWWGALDYKPFSANNKYELLQQTMTLFQNQSKHL